MRRLIFLRDYTEFSGGHLKVWNYFRHATGMRGFQPVVHFSARSRLDESNPWIAAGDDRMTEWSLRGEDIIFLGGNDWEVFASELKVAAPLPVLNIVQGLRHADPEGPLFRHLSRPAIRICVNPLIAQALRPLRPRGPLVTIPIGIDLAEAVPGTKARRVLIAAIKRPAQGREIAAQLQSEGYDVQLLDRPCPRREYLQQVAAAHVALFLPQTIEGFYMPPVEAMALDTVVVCPDCQGNGLYMLPDVNGFLPVDATSSLINAVKRACALSEGDARELRRHARAVASRFDLDSERIAFGSVLDRIDSLWADAG